MTRNITPCAVFTPAPVRRFWRRHSAHSRHPVRLVPKRCVKRTSVHSARCIFWACAWPLSLSGAPKGQTAYTRTPFVLQGHTLPLWVETVRVYEEETVPVTFTEEEAQRRALENLHQLQKLALGEDGRVLTENITYQTKDGAVYVTSRCVCLENIAQEAPLTLPEEPENSENIGVFVGNVQGNG